MIITITNQDPRYTSLKQSHNLRWPASDTHAAGRIHLCDSVESVADVLQDCVDNHVRPTVRSGGHCYEDFVVNNPSGAIIDLSLLAALEINPNVRGYRLSPGAQIGAVYGELFKRCNVTLPAGTCTSVGVGGHIAGGGFGLLSRLYGLATDWVSEIEILTVNSRRKVVARRVNKTHDPDLFRACRGAGAGNFGIITSFHFEQLPPAPKDVVHVWISFDWSGMTERKFITILKTFGSYCETRGQDPDTWGLFAILALSHCSAKTFSIFFQFCPTDESSEKSSVVQEFLALFDFAEPHETHMTAPNPESEGLSAERSRTLNMRRLPWIDAALSGGSFGNAPIRAKYKSAYMKQNFTAEEAKRIYKHLTRHVTNVDLSRSLLAVDSYGGCINTDRMKAETAICQRGSIMKLQYQSYWNHVADDTCQLKWLREFYEDVYSGPQVCSRYASTPHHGDYYEGCYMSYPDIDLLCHPFWPHLYYGVDGLYAFLQDVKREYDPNNIFHHAMSIQPKISASAMSG